MIERYPVLKADDSSKLPENLSVIYEIGQEIISRKLKENSDVFGEKFISHTRVSLDYDGQIKELLFCGNNFAEGKETDYYGDMVSINNLGENIFLVRKNEEEAKKMKGDETIEYLENLVL